MLPALSLSCLGHETQRAGHSQTEHPALTDIYCVYYSLGCVGDLLLQVSVDIALDACSHIIGLVLDKRLAGNMLIELDIAIGDTLNDSRRHLRHMLALLALKSVVHQPLADKLFA